MRFAVAAVVLAVAASSSAIALKERQIGITNPFVCMDMTLPIVGALKVITCSSGSACTIQATADLSSLSSPLLDVSAAVGVSF